MNKVLRKNTQVYHLKQTFYLLPGQKFAADDCAVALLVSNLVLLVSGNLPVLVIEYKPKVPSSIRDVTPTWHLSKFFIQAFYLRKYKSHTTKRKDEIDFNVDDDLQQQDEEVDLYYELADASLV